MDQNATQACAIKGDSWQKILSIYYPGFMLTHQGGGGPTGLPGAPGVYDPAAGNLEVYATGSDHHLVEFFYNFHVRQWRFKDLSAYLGAKTGVSGTPSAVYDIGAGYLEVYATGTGGVLQEYYWNPRNGWHLTSPGGALVSGSPSAVYDPLGKDMEVYAAGRDGDLVEYYFHNGGWHPGGLPKLAVSGSPAAVYDPAGSTLEVYAAGVPAKAGAGARLQELYWNGSAWHAGGLPAQMVTGDPSAVFNPLGDDLEVYTAGVRSGSGAGAPLQELYWHGNAWHQGGLPKQLITGSPSAAYDNEGHTLEVYYAGVPASGGARAPLGELYWNGSKWQAGGLPAVTLTGRPAPVYDNTGDDFEVYTLGVPPAGKPGAPLAETWWSPAGWHQAPASDFTGNTSLTAP